MGHILTDIGEEWYTENNVDGASIDVGLYNDGTDAITDSEDVGDITTEPSNTNYARQTDTVSTFQDGDSDFGFDNDSELSFDFSDQSTSETVDSYFIVVSFTSDTVAGDGSATDHLVATGALSQDRDIGSIDTLNISAGGVGVTID